MSTKNNEGCPICGEELNNGICSECDYNIYDPSWDEDMQPITDTNKVTRSKVMSRYSFEGNGNKKWTACCECERGGNGKANDKCSYGWKSKRWNGLGCFSGTEITGVNNV